MMLLFQQVRRQG